MMKTKFFYVAALILGLAFTTTSCSSDDDNPTVDPANIDYTPENASSWHNYMRNVAALLKTDATNLYNAWNSSYKGGESYASLFKAHSGSPYASALSCVEEIVDKCAEIANEVGTAKIGDPYNLYKAGNTEEALYAVESWYSWHSRDDYTNNIYSIRNAYYGSLDGNINANSLSTVIAGANSSLDTKIKNAIQKAEIANEVGTAKIGDPYNLYKAGNTEEALYAVESWYSWHSRDDYTNNIYSIRNAYYGSLDGNINANSLSTVIAGANSSLDTKIKNAIQKAAKAIQDIPQPFRNHIPSNETVAAMDACAELESILKNDLKSYIANNSNNINTDAVLNPVVTQYVDAVVVPTYKSLKEKNDALYNAVIVLADNPSNSAFETACDAWITAREPWEKSEAFLFGPVDEMGLDPNMDSWPLDQNAIVQILNSQSWSDLEWSEGDDEAAVESAQNVRGFHTLEFLLYKNGEPRKVQ